jgi:hypothetical protein
MKINFFPQFLLDLVQIFPLFGMRKIKNFRGKINSCRKKEMKLLYFICLIKIAFFAQDGM